MPDEHVDPRTDSSNQISGNQAPKTAKQLIEEAKGGKKKTRLEMIKEAKAKRQEQ